MRAHALAPPGRQRPGGWLQPPTRVRVVVAGSVDAPAVAAAAPTVAAVAAVASDVSVAFVSVAVVVG